MLRYRILIIIACMMLIICSSCGNDRGNTVNTSSLPIPKEDAVLSAYDVVYREYGHDLNNFELTEAKLEADAWVLKFSSKRPPSDPIAIPSKESLVNTGPIRRASARLGGVINVHVDRLTGKVLSVLIEQ